MTKKTTSTAEERGLGALVSAPDSRRIMEGMDSVKK